MRQDVKDLMTELDNASNAVAERIEGYKNQIKEGMTGAEVAELKAGLQSEIDQLKGFAHDPENPVPPTGETPPPTE